MARPLLTFADQRGPPVSTDPHDAVHRLHVGLLHGHHERDGVRLGQAPGRAGTDSAGRVPGVLDVSES